jgi:hypothetical protein
VRQASATLEHCQQHQEQARQAVIGLADNYPFDATMDQPVTAGGSFRTDAAAVSASTAKRGC